MTDTKEPVLQLKTPAESNIRLRTAQDNIDKFCRDTQAGDILVVGGASLTGVIGHAAVLLQSFIIGLFYDIMKLKSSCGDRTS